VAETSGAHQVNVRLAHHEYPVHVGPGLLVRLPAFCAEHGLKGKVGIVTDSNVGPLYAGALRIALLADGFEASVVTVPAGEKSKSFGSVEAVCEALIEHGLDRKSFIVALGGGVVGDLTGFAAAIYYRGIPYVQVPTTVLAQVDSSVGGKTGVNARGGKNLIGAFHQPVLVVADTDTLRSLPEREFNEGFAEIIKHGAIRDRAMLEEGLPDDDLPALIARNVAIKARIVEADEKETLGLRALLNFGHTIGHGIENAAGYGTFLHGEAISLGLVAATRLSMEHAGLSEADAGLIFSALEKYRLPTRLHADVATGDILAAMSKDKKFSAGSIRFVLCPRLGEAVVSDKITLAHIEAAIEGLR